MKLIEAICTPINQVINWFYPPFRKLVPIQTFRYAACGGSNMVLDTLLYYLSYNYILEKRLVHLKFLTISPHIAAVFMAFSVTFPTGFFLSKYITFTQSELRGRIQLFRYGLTVFICLILTYSFMKIFVDFMGWYATPSRILTTILVVIYSYFSQKYFTFQTVPTNA